MNKPSEAVCIFSNHSCLNLFEILGIFVTSSLEVFKSAYKKYARENHPDKQGGSTSDPSDKFKRFNGLWSDLRKGDDSELFEECK